ncbi:MAG: DUF4007 family protein [Armatimonadota bacterium]
MTYHDPFGDGDHGQKLGVAFHETFALSRPAISQILKLAVEVAQDSPDGSCNLSNDAIREGTSLGLNYVKAMGSYARGCGLLGPNKHLTRLGQLVAERDPGLSDLGTQWVMHYNMCAPHLYGPDFWHPLLMAVISSGSGMSSEDVVEGLNGFVNERRARELAPRTVKATATVFLGTYTKPDGLGNLNAICEVEPATYARGEPTMPRNWVAAYVIADYWRANWRNALGINLTSIKEIGGPASLLMLSSGEMNSCLGDLQSLGLVQLQRRVPPFQVSRLWSSPEEILEHLYD